MDPQSLLTMSKAVEVEATETKSTISNTEENLKALEQALVAKFGNGLKVNSAVIKAGGLLPSGERRVPFAVLLKSKPGGSLTCWVTREDPDCLMVVWSGIITSALLNEAGIQRI